jgi:hypothetical protein
MQKRPVTPRISPQVGDWLEKTFSSRTSGAEYTLEAFYHLYRKTLAGVRGRFDQGELCLMLDVFNGTYLTPMIAGEHLLINAVDGMALDGLDEKWEVDRELFTGKLKSLTQIEAACLEIWATGFWRGGDTGKDLDIEKYIKWLL